MEVAFGKSKRVAEATPYKFHPQPVQGVHPVRASTWGYEAQP